MSTTIQLSQRGKTAALPAIELLGVNIISQGRLLKIGEIFDEYWLERSVLPPYVNLISELLASEQRPDLFTFAQRVPDAVPVYPYHWETENYAVLPLTTYDRWLKEQVPSTTKRNVKASEKRGITVRACTYDDDYVRGVSSIYNESPIRAGRRFWHYGKELDAVRRENGTYAERSLFLAAYHQDEMVGYLKVVFDRRTAAVMQILSKLAYRDHRTNNALMAEAVRQCCMRGIEFLLYEKFDYGNKTGDSLTRFKQSNGFGRLNVPRYYVPLTAKGRLALRLGLHRNAKDRIPEWIGAPLRNLRQRWHERGIAPS